VQVLVHDNRLDANRMIIEGLLVEYAAPATLVRIRYFFRFERTLGINDTVCVEAPTFQCVPP
jgi:hypothetical protein